MVCMGRMSPPRISTHPPTPQLTCTISMCSIHSYATTTTWCTYSLHLGGVVYSTCYVVCRRLPAVCMVCRSIWGLCAVPQEVVFPTTTISRGVHSRDPGAHHQLPPLRRTWCAGVLCGWWDHVVGVPSTTASNTCKSTTYQVYVPHATTSSWT